MISLIYSGYYKDIQVIYEVYQFYFRLLQSLFELIYKQKNSAGDTLSPAEFIKKNR